MKRSTLSLLGVLLLGGVLGFIGGRASKVESSGAPALQEGERASRPSQYQSGDDAAEALEGGNVQCSGGFRSDSDLVCDPAYLGSDGPWKVLLHIHKTTADAAIEYTEECEFAKGPFGPYEGWLIYRPGQSWVGFAYASEKHRSPAETPSRSFAKAVATALGSEESHECTPSNEELTISPAALLACHETLEIVDTVPVELRDPDTRSAMRNFNRAGSYIDLQLAAYDMYFALEHFDDEWQARRDDISRCRRALERYEEVTDF